jgi:hypothetical protein
MTRFGQAPACLPGAGYLSTAPYPHPSAGWKLPSSLDDSVLFQRVLVKIDAQARFHRNRDDAIAGRDPLAREPG